MRGNPRELVAVKQCAYDPSSYMLFLIFSVTLYILLENNKKSVDLPFMLAIIHPILHDGMKVIIPCVREQDWSFVFIPSKIMFSYFGTICIAF